MLKKKENDFKQIGVVGVDSGTILLGDPCYWLSNKDWKKEVLNPNFDLSREIYYDLGHKGKGVLVSSGYGDGSYPVFAKFKDDRVKEVKIKFF